MSRRPGPGVGRTAFSQGAGAEGDFAAAAWLRFVRERGGRKIGAGLFETTAHGLPLGFGFARIEASDDRDPCAVSSLMRSLFGTSTAAPALAFGMADEIPERAFDALDVGTPVCRILPPASGGNPDILHGRMLWSGVLAPGSAAERLFGEIVKRSDPLEPLERTARGLAEALADPQVRTLSEIPGLRTVMALSARCEIPDSQLRRGIAPSAAEDAPVREPDVEHGLARRLWAVLAVPPTAAASTAPDTNLQWPASLMPFQRDGVQALIEMDRLLLSDDMGLGKTVQAVAAIRILRARGEIGSCLVVAPAGVLDQWRREVAKWAPDLTAIIVRGPADDRVWQWKARRDITLVSYDVLRSDAALPPSGKAWDVVVLDEAQRIKNRNDTSEAAKNIPRIRSWALTGTPIENDEEELASIMEFVDHDDGMPRKRYRPGAALLWRHRELQLRRKKGDVLDDLPPKLEAKLTIPLHPDQRESYEKAEREGIVYLRSLGEEVGVRHILELITRLKQICNFDPRTRASSKLEDIENRLRTLTSQGHKALVFSQYTSDASGVAAVANRLRAFNPLTLTGDIPAERRSVVIDRFKTSGAHQVLVVSLRAGGLGLNLQEASYVFHLDRWWNPAVERQAEDRSHRMGQTVKVNVLKYTCENTIEERIDRILDRKQALFDRLVDDVSIDLSKRMNRKELLALFDLG